jgi:hypothetical protein
MPDDDLLTVPKSDDIGRDTYLTQPIVENLAASEDLVRYRGIGPVYNFRGVVGWCIPVALICSCVLNILGLT